jgi:hypothetical protein
VSLYDLYEKIRGGDRSGAHWGSSVVWGAVVRWAVLETLSTDSNMAVWEAQLSGSWRSHTRDDWSTVLQQDRRYCRRCITYPCRLRVYLVLGPVAKQYLSNNAMQWLTRFQIPLPRCVEALFLGQGHVGAASYCGWGRWKSRRQRA